MLEAIGYDATTAGSFARWAAADSSAARVAQVDGGIVTVLTDTGPRRVSLGGSLLRAVAEDPAGTPCPGDWVVLRSWPDGRLTLEHVLPRRTVLAPPLSNSSGPSRPGVPLAANMDLVVVVAGRLRAHQPDRVRALTDLAAGSGATPVLVAPPPADLRAHVGGRRTVALLADDASALAELVRALTGAHPIGDRRDGPRPAPPTSALRPLPGGGAVVDVLLPGAPAIRQRDLGASPRRGG